VAVTLAEPEPLIPFLLPVCGSHSQRRPCPRGAGLAAAGLPRSAQIALAQREGSSRRHVHFPRDGTTATQQKMCSAMEFKGWEDSNYTQQLTQDIFNNTSSPHFNSRLR